MITPIGQPQPKEKESAWDKISKVMGFTTTAVKLADGVGEFVDMIKPDPMNAMARRLAGQAVGPKRTGVTF